MKKIIFVFVLLMGLVIPANAFTTVEKEMGFVSVNAKAVKEVAPDTASIKFFVDTKSVDSKDAIKQNKEESTKLIDSLKALLSDDNSVIQTTNFVLKPNYITKDGKKTFVDYSATNSISVKTKSISKMSEIIDIATKNGATSVSDLNFYVENEKQFEGQLAKQALSDAKIIAELTASTLGQKVTGIRAVRVNIYPQTVQNATFLNAKSTSGSSLPVEKGKIKIQANVDAEFYVK